MSEPQLIACDWINLEGRLTAYFSGDTNLQSMLDDELKGGYKVHAMTAALLYKIDPKDAKTHLVNIQGQTVAAYEGGKRCRHLFHYGGGPGSISNTFWLPIKEAESMYETLSDAHPGVVAWWKRLGDQVFGIHLYECPLCQEQGSHGGDCLGCKIKGQVIPMRWMGWAQEPERVFYTRFKRRRIYLGRRSQSMNALIAQEPQSSGASMWYDVTRELFPWDGVYSSLVNKVNPILTGTYDSFLGQSRPMLVGRGAKTTEDMIQWITRSMEKPWPQLGGIRFPVDVAVGYNWRKYNEKLNPRGLRDVHYIPFTTE